MNDVWDSFRPTSRTEIMKRWAGLVETQLQQRPELALLKDLAGYDCCCYSQPWEGDPKCWHCQAKELLKEDDAGGEAKQEVAVPSG